MCDDVVPKRGIIFSTRFACMKNNKWARLERLVQTGAFEFSSMRPDRALRFAKLVISPREPACRQRRPRRRRVYPNALTFALCGSAIAGSPGMVVMDSVDA